MIEQPYHQPSEVAKLLGVSAFTVRRWCEWHSAYLSPNANPSPGRPRRLSAQDVEVMRHVAQLRTQGLTTVEINAQLEGKTFAVVESELQQSAQDAPSDAQELRVSELAPIQAIVQALQPFEARLAKLEARPEPKRFDVQSFAIGVIVAGVFFALMIGLAVLFRG